MTRRRRLQSSFSSSWLLLVLHLPFILSQKSSATCAAGWDWANNKSGDSPCDIAAQLLDLCQPDGSFTLPAGGFYTPSSSSSAAIRANTCACNVVVYNLLAACQSCQENGSSVLSWSSYAGACTSCSSENGISPGPCGAQQSIGFPSSVRPEDGSVEIPAWAYYNSSGDAWDVADARRAVSGQETTLSAAPVPTPSASSSPGPASSSSSPTKGLTKAPVPPQVAPLSQGMKAAVIVCSVLAALILVVFVTYLLRLCHARKRQKRLKEFSDAAFDQVMPTQKPKSPKKLHFKRMMSRITLGPKTPGAPKTPGLPPITPKTGRFFDFGRNPFSPKHTTHDQERMMEETAPLSAALASIPLQEKSGSKSRTESVASSNYSEYNSYNPSLQRVPSKASSVGSSTSKGETVTTGSVKGGQQPKIRGGGHGNTLSASAPSILVSDADDTDAAAKEPQKLRAARVKSQTAKVSRWSDSSNGTSEQGGVTWDRMPSMTSNASSARHKSRTVSERSSRKIPSSLPDLPETLQSPYPESTTPQPEEVDIRPDNRRSDVSTVSSSSTVRRFQGAVNQLDFGDVDSPVMTRPRTQRQSSKSTRTTTVPPSPNGSTMGFAM